MAEKAPAYISGFCGTGAHEGTRPKSPSGKPRKTCDPILTFRDKQWKCGCKCHADLDKLFEMSGMPRVTQVNPEYIPEKVVIAMPTVEERAARFKTTDAVPPRVIQSPLPDRVPATIERSFTPTSSGRAARGELELRVKQACDRWILDKPEESCTPQWISDWIVETHGVSEKGTAPSVGAISAVFDRWTAIGFALIGKKPTRFVGYMPDGVKYGLEGMKDRARKAKQQGLRR